MVRLTQIETHTYRFSPQCQSRHAPTPAPLHTRAHMATVKSTRSDLHTHIHIAVRLETLTSLNPGRHIHTHAHMHTYTYGRQRNSPPNHVNSDHLLNCVGSNENDNCKIEFNYAKETLSAAKMVCSNTYNYARVCSCMGCVCART